MSSIDKIVIGEHEFTREDILSGEVFVSNSIPCDELAADALNATLDGSEERYTIFAPSDADGLLTVNDELFVVLPRFRVLVHDLSAFGYGEPVFYYRGETLVGKFYLVRPQRVGKHTFDISCTSAIGLLERLQHYGGIYNGTTAGNVIEGVIGGAIEYTVDPAVASIPVYGWLPIGTRRDNLRQILFATGASIKKSSIGEVHIAFLDSAGQTPISDDRISLSGSVDYKTPATAVSVTEHSYGQFATDETVTLYDGPVTAAEITTPNGAVAVGMLVKFSDPIHTLSIVGGTIVESGVNYAVISGGYVTLTGKKYTHATNVIMRQAKNLPAGATENLVKVEGATLVSAANSGNVAERVLAFYSASRVVKTKILYGDERPGDTVAFSNPFDESTVGLIQSQSISISNTLMADTEIAVGYVPSGGGNNYTHVEVLTGNGTWVPPAGVTKVRAVIVSGGAGGHVGYPGEAGQAGESFSNGHGNSTTVGYYWGQGGDGGEPGQGGVGGKVYEVDVETTPGTPIPYSGGIGGTGESVSNPASNGAASTFGAHSSNSGGVRPFGYFDPFTGQAFAGTGAIGIAGGKGTGSEPGAGETIIPGNPIADASGGLWVPGAAGGDRASSGDSGKIVSGTAGGSGGGAAVGANGVVGGDGYALVTKNGSAYTARATGGNGGGGANAAPQIAQTALGFGGFGGHGGGGGGGSGEAAVSAWYSSTPPSITKYINPGVPGIGGQGGQGGQGGPGCIIVYY